MIQNKKIKGFTLIELLITLVIVAVLLTIALPSFKQTIAQNSLDSEASSLFHTLAFARLEAIKRGVNVTVCPSTNATSCSATASYDQGWIVFVDTNTIGTFDGSDELLRYENAAPANVSIIGDANYISFTASGILAILAIQNPYSSAV